MLAVSASALRDHRLERHGRPRHWLGDARHEGSHVHVRARMVARHVRHRAGLDGQVRWLVQRQRADVKAPDQDFVACSEDIDPVQEGCPLVSRDQSTVVMESNAKRPRWVKNYCEEMSAVWLSWRLNCAGICMGAGQRLVPAITDACEHSASVPLPSVVFSTNFPSHPTSETSSSKVSIT